MTALTDDLHLAVTIDRDVATTRLQGASPAVSNVGVQYSITAGPATTLASSAGPTLRTGTIPAGTTLLDAPYSNPFAARDWPALLMWHAYASRPVTTRLLPVTLNAGMYEYRLAGEAGTSTLPAGLPQGLTFDGVPLSSDNLVIPQPTHAVTVEYLTDRPESTTVFQLVLYEMAPNTANTSLVYQTVIAFAGRTPRFTLPADLFLPGKLYVLRAVATAGGYEPGALESGDLTRRALPYAVGYLDGGVFEVR